MRNASSPASPARSVFDSTRPVSMPLTPVVSPKLTCDEASDTSPPCPTTKRPCDRVVCVASSSSERPAFSVAPSAMRISPRLLSTAAPRSTVACAPLDKRNSAPPASAARVVAPLAGTLLLPVSTAPLRTSMLSVAVSSNSGTFTSPAALLATTIWLAPVVICSTAPTRLRCPPSSKLPPSPDSAWPSSCRKLASMPGISPRWSTTAMRSALMSTSAARPAVAGAMTKLPARLID